MRKVVWHRRQDLLELKTLSNDAYVSIGVGLEPVDVILDGCFTVAELRRIIDVMNRLEIDDMVRQREARSDQFEEPS